MFDGGGVWGGVVNGEKRGEMFDFSVDFSFESKKNHETYLKYLGSNIIEYLIYVEIINVI